jgi:hypothetical protein
MVLVGAGIREEDVKNLSQRNRDRLVQERGEVAEAYQYAGMPTAVSISSSGRIASPLAAGAEAINLLVRRAVAFVIATAATKLALAPGPTEMR